MNGVEHVMSLTIIKQLLNSVLFNEFERRA